MVIPKTRFQVTYKINNKTYIIVLPGISASHICRSWDRPGSSLISVEEIVKK